ncbi:hypothetical protein [Ruminococcus sp.]|uniref:hypothetical protein n=1 Tax=Ruminococcus sp. TaxID=41978 RepID=UPI0025D4F3BB|nr:hypothetical protein [Ruminococcus sp.]
MKSNIHKKMIFEDTTEKKWIRSCFKGWAHDKRINRQLFRRRMDEQCRKGISDSSDSQHQDSVKNTTQTP